MHVSELKGQKVMVAVSGGLDSCTISHWLSQQGVEVIAYTADLGQPDEDDIEDAGSACWPGRSRERSAISKRP